jgi:hypothetical protein
MTKNSQLWKHQGKVCLQITISKQRNCSKTLENYAKIDLFVYDIAKMSLKMDIFVDKLPKKWKVENENTKIIKLP